MWKYEALLTLQFQLNYLILEPSERSESKESYSLLNPFHLCMHMKNMIFGSNYSLTYNNKVPKKAEKITICFNYKRLNGFKY